MSESAATNESGSSRSTIAPVVELVGVKKSFVDGETETEVLHGIDLRIEKGELVALIGPSGSGKSTLLNLLGLLDRPTSGKLSIDGVDTAEMDDAARTSLRRRALGFVFQFHHLIPALTAEENVRVPLALERGWMSASLRPRAMEVLEAVGLKEKADVLPRKLSGGQQQRVAIARALVGHPPLVLADEPTGNLDTASGEQVFELFREFHRKLHTAFVIVTHDPRIAASCDRIVEIVDGRIVSDAPTAALHSDQTPSATSKPIAAPGPASSATNA